MMDAEPSPSQAIYEAAEALVRIGVSVIPIQPGTKEPPAGFRWGEYAGRIADASERYEWFINREYQLAVVAGVVSGGLTPLDFDDVGGYEALAARYPKLETFPRVRTGSGKTHVWLRTKVPTEKYNTTIPGGGKLEVRAGTHYTLVPPSLHPSGNRYEWVVPPWDGIPRIELESIGLTTKRRNPEQEAGEPLDDDGEPLTEQERRIIVNLIQEHYEPGDRHEICLALAGWLASHEVPESDARWVVRTLAEEAGDHNRVKEFVRGVKSTYTRARQGFAVVGWSRLVNPERRLISPSTEKQLDLLLRYRNPVFVFDGDDGDNSEAEDGNSEIGNDQFPWLISVFDLMAEPEEPDDWLIQGFVRHPTVSLVVGPGKTYKSIMVQEMAVAVASGTPMFGEFPVPEPQPVIYVQEESSRRGVRKRFAGITAGRGFHPATFKDTLYTITNRGFQLDKPKDIQRLIAEGIEQTGAKLVIFDPLREMHGADENQSKEMRPILQAMKYLRDKYGVSVVVVHHSNKSPEYTNPQDAIRGSTSIWAAMDGGVFVANTDRDGEKKVLVVLKEGDQVPPFVYRPVFANDSITFDTFPLDGKGKAGTLDERLVSVLNRTPGWLDIKQVSELIGRTERTVRPRLAVLAARGAIEARGEGHKRVYAALGTAYEAPDF